jgi:hypothetical protein
MATFLQQVNNRIMARTHHSFVLHGSTRDYQLGVNGSCSLVDYLIEVFGTQAQPRLVAIYRVGLGWRFGLDSDKARFMAITGTSASTGTDPFAGLAGNKEQDELPIEIAPAVGLIDAALRQQDVQVVIVIDRAELVCANGSYDRLAPSDKAVLSMLQAVASDRSVEDSGNLLFLVTDVLVDLHESLRLATSRYCAIEIDPPDREERLAIGQKVLPQLAAAGVTCELTPAQFASATSMLSRYGLMDVLRDAQAQGSLTKAQVREVKSNAMSQEYGEVIEVLDPLERGFMAIAGMTPLKSYFTNVVNDMIAGNLSDVPTGVLLAGAAGLGKTFFVRGLAGASGLPTINFDISKVLGSFVGQSERNLERAIVAIKSAQPCIVVIDEIESVFPNRAANSANGDSGVSSRILKRMLEVLSDPSLRGRVLWIGITNYPQNLDAALARAGRFDLTVAFVPPTQEEIEELVRLYSAKYDVDLGYPLQEDFDPITSRLAGYTPAEIENVARKTRSLVAQGLGAFTAWDAAIDKIRSNTRGVQSMTDSALMAVNDSDLLPESYIARWRQLTQQDAPAQPSKTQQDPAVKKLF